jgi:hypothetical protein
MKNADKSIYPIYKGDNDIISDYGLTKREYFAGLAMQGLSTELISNAIKLKEIGVSENEIYKSLKTKDIIKSAIEFADELLKQLES